MCEILIETLKHFKSEINLGISTSYFLQKKVMNERRKKNKSQKYRCFSTF